MKIIELRFKNLNSLYGEWHINFTASDYEMNGIFALTGPTGAGKSTILDAICLALYGATPRLGRISASTNDIMSRQTGECFAEVVFASQAGVFRCRWSQRRARKVATGNLQSQEHQIAEAQSGKLLESRVSRVVGVVEEKTGMDFERFTRSVLLAQGSFDTFLKADAEQKSKLLEQITGTEIYSSISQRVHERLREEREALSALTAEVAAIGVLSAEDEQQIHLEQTQKAQAQQALQVQQEQLNAALAWLIGLERLTEDIGKLEAQQADLALKVQQFTPSRQRLALAQQAAVLDGAYAELCTLRQQQAEEEIELKTLLAQQPQLAQQVEQKAAEYQVVLQQLAVAKQQQEVARPLLQQVRVIDQQLPKPYQQLRHLPLMSVAAERERIEQLLAGRLLREYEQEKETLWREKLLLSKIASLEEERAALEAHTPCPLCGATEHPYVHQSQLPALDKVEQRMQHIDYIMQQVAICTENSKKAELSELVAKRRALYGDQDPDEQEQRLQRAVESVERAELHLRNSQSALQQRYVSAQTKQDSLQQRLKQRQATLLAQQADIDSAIKQAGFSDEAAFLAARLSPAQREQLAAQAQALDNALLSLQSRLQDRQAMWQAEQAKQMTTASKEQLLPLQADCRLQLEQCQGHLAQLTYQLQQNQVAQAQIQAKQSAIAAQQKESLKWEQLHALIGSADGKKYRNFAQGLSFELMVQQANKQLEKMTDRYLLVHDATEPLTLDVIDNYQAGEMRSTKNLSGGESFIVSLSLALGLSKMASQKVRVDSLFLDEGFGTLDEDALDTALGTLAGLQQEGKLIGVISHVPALKDRIATQVRVIAGQGGRSQIDGPGCSQLHA